MIEMVGKKFGRLIVIKKAKRVASNGCACWDCECDCGKKIVATGPHLRNGGVKSCGCLRKELSAKRATTHGKSYTPEHDVWHSMIQRCTNSNAKNYKNYGGRGIKVCKRWMRFEAFFADMGKRPEGLTIERLDNNGNYEPSNCKWATWSEQNRNQRISTRSTSGVLGVSYYKHKQKYQASIGVDGKNIHLGYFDLLSDAIEARKQGEIKYWPKADLLEAEPPDKIVTSVAAG